MKDLLSNYSLSEIIFFLIITAVAVKEAIQFIDWFKARIKQYYDKDNEVKEEHEKLENEIEDLNKFYDEKKIIDDTFTKYDAKLERLTEQIAMLVESDKENIKAYITERHHYFVEEKGWVDYHSMDCLEKRFAIYQKEHGNSFAADLMNDLRSLSKQPYEEN